MVKTGPRGGVQAGLLSVQTFDAPAAIEPEWRLLEATGVLPLFQRFDWVDAYCRHALPHENAQAAIVVGRLRGATAFILPMAVSAVGPVQVASWIGGVDSAYNFGLWSREGAACVTALGRGGIETMLRDALPGVDCAVLGRTLGEEEGLAQPLGALQSSLAPTEGYACDLAGGFAAVLKRTDGASRRRRVLAKERKLREAGVFDIRIVDDAEEAAAALDFFFEQKGRQLTEQNRVNSFTQGGVTDFYHDLARRSIGMSDPVFEIARLTVDGQTRAMLGSGVHRGRLNGCMTVFRNDELAPHSPGQVLTFRNIERACERALSVYDMGLGFEEYKTHWCGETVALRDAYAAFTTLGTAAVAAVRLGQATKDRMRRHEPLWRQIKSAQAYLARFSAARSGR